MRIHFTVALVVPFLFALPALGGENLPPGVNEGMMDLIIHYVDINHTTTTGADIRPINKTLLTVAALSSSLALKNWVSSPTRIGPPSPRPPSNREKEAARQWVRNGWSVSLAEMEKLPTGERLGLASAVSRRIIKTGVINMSCDTVRPEVDAAISDLLAHAGK